MTRTYQRSNSAAAPGQPSRQPRRGGFLTGRGVARQHPGVGSRWSHVRIVPSRPSYERSSTEEQRSPKPCAGGSNPSARAKAAQAASTLTSEETYIACRGRGLRGHNAILAPP